MDILEKFSTIRAFMFDIDGVLTDGGILVLENGDMARVFNTKDGYALQLAVKKGYLIFAVSGSSPSAAQRRLNNLGVSEVYFQVHDKRSFVLQLMQKHKLQKDEVLFMGDDMPDLATFDVIGLSACPADAVPDVRDHALYISPYSGGRGCARDVLEKVMRCHGHWQIDHTIASK
ncbi:MAG: HAD hydrolase family protein [Niabella sp.]